MIYESKFNKVCDIKCVDVLPLEAYDTATMYRTGIIPADAITTNKTFNNASLGQIKGRLTDPFMELEVAKLPDLFAGAKNDESAPKSENENSQK